jgi:hypothetical protein
MLNDKSSIVDEEKTVAIGNAYQPLLAIMENMQKITQNIRIAIQKKDVQDIVIK